MRALQELARGELGKLPVVANREVVPDGVRLRLHEVEVVEEPLGGRRNGNAPVDVVGQDEIGVAQEVQVRVQPGEDVVPSPPALPGDREGGREGPGALLEPLEAEHLTPERRSLNGTASSEEPSPHVAG